MLSVFVVQFPGPAEVHEKIFLYVSGQFGVVRLMMLTQLRSSKTMISSNA
jgi:hypothetical protein